MLLRALAVAAASLACSVAGAGTGTTVKELTRLEGQGESVLRGVGLVIGLPGTGDSTADLKVARPLIALLKANGQDVGLPDEGKGKKNDVRSVALVSVTCVVPREGARTDDKFDVTVSTLNTASDLSGGELYLTTLQGPIPGAPVYAIASGRVEIEGQSNQTSGRVRGGARMIRDVLMPEVADAFDLIIEPPFAGWPSAATIADAIQSSVAIAGHASVSTPRIARVIDERTIRVTIPAEERAEKAAFLADVLSAEVKPELLDLPAQVIVNRATGAIIVTGDVQISPVAITHKDLTITTTVPGPAPTSQTPIVRRDRWADVKTSASPRENARLADLLAAFEKLAVPVEEQINVLQMLHKTGKLHARLVMD
ncbi:MAG TPA: flagellar basal body P-ring protein FlgI [Phycisphaerales bacterium]|nr:flagellar basal body P-ring protein FlgI [Phycisphaerales bacterium]